ncbi:MAG: energy-coupling factor transporter ATPase, partial [Firmicutes bacterium]|nr:energy-coupling factor transporter ATPase [Bacillota bacterium]
MIVLDKVKFAYAGADEYAVKGVSLQIAEGSFVAILGHNGSGKSTLAKLLNGLLLPSGGSVVAYGFDTSDKKQLYEVRKSVGVVFQNPDNQAVASIIEDDVAFGLENLGVPSAEIRQRVDEALKAVGMYEHREGTPFRLSGGQKQRLAIAAVVAMRPKTIVFDEATSMLDPQGRQEVLEIAKRLQKEGTTIVWVTHFASEVVDADRIVVMHKGRIAMEGDKHLLRQVDKLQELKLSTALPYALVAGLNKHGFGLAYEDTLEAVAKQIAERVDAKSMGDATVMAECVPTPSTTESVIKAEDLRFVYSPKAPFRTVALDGVDIEIFEKDFLGIIGHTGSGKSTFVTHLNGLTKTTQGCLRVCGTDLTAKYDKKRLRSQVGLVFQYPEYQLFEETVEKDVAFGPKNLGLDAEEISQRVQDAIEQVGLVFAEVRDKSPFELSGGQKRRVALAGVLAMRPSV